MSPAAPILHSKYNVFIEKFLSDSKNKGQNPVTCYVKRGNGICLTYFILIDIFIVCKQGFLLVHFYKNGNYFCESSFLCEKLEHVTIMETEM